MITPRIFISYRSSDLALAKLVRSELANKLGHSRVYIDESIYGGNHIDSQLATELLNSTIFLPLLTDAYWGKLPRKISLETGEEVRYRIEEEGDFIGREFNWALNPKVALDDAVKDDAGSKTKDKQNLKNKVAKVLGLKSSELKSLSLLPMKLSEEDRPDADPFNNSVTTYIDKLNSLRFVDINLGNANLMSKDEISNIKSMFSQTYRQQGRLGLVSLAWFRFERKAVECCDYFRKLNILFVPCSLLAMMLGVYLWVSDNIENKAAIQQIKNANVDIDYLVKNIRSVTDSLDLLLEPHTENPSQYQSISISARMMRLRDRLGLDEPATSNSAWAKTENVNERIESGLKYAEEIAIELKNCSSDSDNRLCVSGKTVKTIDTEYLSLLAELESQITIENQFWYCDLAAAYTKSGGSSISQSYLTAASLFHKYFKGNAENADVSTAECNRQYLDYLPIAYGRFSNMKSEASNSLDDENLQNVEIVLSNSEPNYYVDLGIKTMKLFENHKSESSVLKGVEVFRSTYDTIGLLTSNQNERIRLEHKMLANYSYFDRQGTSLNSFVEQLQVKYRKGINDLALEDLDSSIDSYTAILGDLREIF